MKTSKCRVRHLRCGRFFNPRWGFNWHASLPSLVLPVVYFTQFPLVHEVHSQGVAAEFGGKQKEWCHENEWKWKSCLWINRTDSWAPRGSFPNIDARVLAYECIWRERGNVWSFDQYFFILLIKIVFPKWCPCHSQFVTQTHLGKWFFCDAGLPDPSQVWTHTQAWVCTHACVHTHTCTRHHSDYLYNHPLLTNRHFSQKHTHFAVYTHTHTRKGAQASACSRSHSSTG